MKKKLESGNVLAILGLVIFVLFVLYNASGSILEKFGVETRTALKAELVRTQQLLDICSDNVDKQRKVIVLNEMNCKLRIDADKQFIEDSMNIDKIVNDAIAERDKRETHVIPDSKDGDEIVSINNLYENLFGA